MLLDTSFIIDVLREQKEALEKLAVIETEHFLSTTEINILELYKGAYFSKKTNKNLEMISELLETVTILKIEPACYNIYGSLASQLHSKGIFIGHLDEVIAAIALLNNEPILTKDKHFTYVEDLIVYYY
jgi:predicted nucleic acid-binding protein